MLNFHLTPPSIVTLVSGLATMVLASYVFRRRDAVAGTSLACVLVAAALWNIPYGLELAAADPALMRFFGDLKYLGIVTLPPAWWVFALMYTARARLVTPRMIALLTVEPLVLLALLFWPDTHDLIRFYVEPVTWPADAEVGPLFWVHVAYAYTLLAGGTGLLVVSLIRASRFYRRASLALLLAVSVPWAANALYNFDVGAFAAIDYTPAGFSFAAIVLIWGVFRLQLLDVMPVARTTIIETMNDGVVVLDPFQRIVDLNPAARRILRATDRDLIGQPADRLLPAHTVLLSRSRGRSQVVEEVTLGPPASPRAYELTSTALGREPDERSARLLVLRDVTERKLAEQHLRRMVHYDPLTGLANREQLADHLNQALTRARDRQESVALLFCDLDRFKLVNDTLGHDNGDVLLQRAARRLSRCLREEDLIARLGGDEFTIVLPEPGSASYATQVAARLLDSLAAPFHLAGQELHITASIGVALWPEDGESAADLLRHADVAMYRAKRHGRNRFEVAARGTPGGIERVRLEDDLRQAVGRGELVMHYQPVHALDDGRVVGVEALLRWQHPRHGLLLPARFLPLAHETSLISALDAWALRTACRWTSEWSAQRPEMSLGVNVSAQRLAQAGMAADVANALDQTSLDPASLTLEISEQALFGDRLSGIGKFSELKRLGARLALDDFGTGSTSLTHLNRMPLDQLKIDRLFIEELARHDGDRMIVSAMINLAHTLGLSVVAEGVEQPVQLEVLRALGCDAAQGFVFSQGVPGPAARALLLDRT